MASRLSVLQSRVLLFLLIMCCALRGQQTSLPRAPGAKILDLSAAARFSEPSIAVNPTNPKQVVVVYQGGASVQGSANVGYSNNAGDTFATAEGTHAPDWRVLGDVTTTFDNKGHAFLCYLAFDKLGANSYWARGAGRNGIFVRRSLDGGKTWEQDAIAIKAWPTGHEANIQFEDEPRIFADNSPQSRLAGNLYVGWVEWQLEKSVMLFSRSTDDGKTWSTPKQISVHAGLPRDDNGSLGGYVQAIGSDGTIYAIWDDGNSVVLTQSLDGGKSFTVPRAVLEVGPPYFGEVPGVSRVEGFPQIAVDTSTGANRGRIYICWSDYRNGDVDVFLSSSGRDHGWSKPVRVNNDAIHDGNDQFYQWMTVDPKTGAVYVMFYDRRDDPANRQTRVTLARSTDGGRTFDNYAWTANTFHGQQNTFLGDYTWLAAFDNHVYGAWTENAPLNPATSQTNEAARQAQAASKTVIRVGCADFSRP